MHMKRRDILVGVSANVIMGSHLRAVAARERGTAAGSGADNTASISGGRKISDSVFVTHQSIDELSPGKLYRYGCTVKAERLSWLAEPLDAYEPLNAYVFIDGDDALFIDTNAAIAEPSLRSILAKHVESRRAHVTFTRNEAECIGNLGYILGKGRDPVLHFGGVGGIFEWINDPDVHQLEVQDFLGKIPVEQVPSPTRKSLGSLDLRWFDAGVKEMYLTQWVFEETTGCLFTSDAFGFRHLDDAASTPVIDTVDRLPLAEEVAREFSARMNWLPGSAYPDVIARFESIFDELDVRMIAPVHGCVLKGRDVVDAHVALAIDALRLAQDFPPHGS
jgi:hypothetical protein